MPKRLVLLAAALAACAPRTPPPDLSLDPAELLAQVQAAQARVRSVRGDARIQIRSPDGSGTVSALVAAERPDRVYVHTVDFFGNTLAVLATAGGALSLYDARAGVLYRGPATPQNLARLIPVPLSPEDLAAILCGAAPLIDGVAERAEPGRGFVTLELVAGERTESLRVGPGAAVQRAALRVAGAAGPSGWDLAIARADAPGGGTFAEEVTLSAESPEVRLRLAWQEAEWNAPIDAALFSPAPPRGVRIVDLGEAPPPPGAFAPPAAGE
jgi:outer membrane lipoprotein-sorting protein